MSPCPAATAGARKAEWGPHRAEGLTRAPRTLACRQYLQDIVADLCQVRGFMTYCIISF